MLVRMNIGTIEFGGSEYPDGEASDPEKLALMQGSPPPAAKRIRFEDDRILDFPQIRWSLSHMRELMPTVAVWRGPGTAADLPVTEGREADIDALAFDDLDGRRHTWAESLTHTYTDGIMVLHRGARIYERYFGALRPQRPHACFSITKSYAATLAATLIHERALDERKPVAYYLPEMAATAYEDATLRQVLDMQVGVRYSEDYADPQAEIWDYSRAGGLRARTSDYAGPSNYYEYLVTLRKSGQHGAAFEYKTVNTEVMCWVMQRVTGIPLAEMLSQRIWSPIGCEEDGYLSVDSIGTAMGGGGLSACLARFGPVRRTHALRGGLARQAGAPGRGHRRYPPRVRPGQVCKPANIPCCRVIRTETCGGCRTTNWTHSKAAASMVNGCTLPPRLSSSSRAFVRIPSRPARPMIR